MGTQVARSVCVCLRQVSTAERCAKLMAVGASCAAQVRCNLHFAIANAVRVCVCALMSVEFTDLFVNQKLRIELCLTACWSHL